MPKKIWLTLALSLSNLAACGASKTAQHLGDGDADADGDGDTDGDADGDADVGVEPGQPVVFYSDLVSAPAGAYVTFWGRGFGQPQGSSTISLGGTALDVVSWADRMIVVRVPAGAASGSVVVRTPIGDSPGISLGVHPGNLWFVSPSGDDGAAGSEGAPFRSATRGRDALQPGDVLYFREGTWAGEEQFEAVLPLERVPSGTAERPVAIVGYPGETAVLGDNSATRVFHLYRGDNGEASLDYLTIAKLTIRARCTGVTILNRCSHGRLVGNELTGANSFCADGAISVTTTATDWKIYGNDLHDNGDTKFEHGIYLGGFGTNSDFEIAWNRIRNHVGGRSIQIYGHAGGDRIENVSIHDNEIFDVDRDGILLGHTDADTLEISNVRIFNNLMSGAGRCSGYAIKVGNRTATGISIFHNTLVDNGGGTQSCDESQGQTFGQILVENAVDVDIRDNILVTVGGESAIDATGGNVSASGNLYFGAGAFGGDGSPVTGDPAFTDTAGRDFHLQASSAAIDHGAPNDVERDHDGLSRNQGAGADIGAYEYVP